MTTDPFLAFYEGKDAIPGDVNPYPEGSACWHAWQHGFSSEWDERRPMTDEEVAEAFACLNA